MSIAPKDQKSDDGGDNHDGIDGGILSTCIMAVLNMKTRRRKKILTMTMVKVIDSVMVTKMATEIHNRSSAAPQNPRTRKLEQILLKTG